MARPKVESNSNRSRESKKTSYVRKWASENTTPPPLEVRLGESYRLPWILGILMDGADLDDETRPYASVLAGTRVRVINPGRLGA